MNVNISIPIHLRYHKAAEKKNLFLFHCPLQQFLENVIMLSVLLYKPLPD